MNEEKFLNEIDKRIKKRFEYVLSKRDKKKMEEFGRQLNELGTNIFEVGTAIQKIICAYHCFEGKGLYEKKNNMKKQTHYLAIYPEYFEAIASGRKRFEVRRKSRGFQVGDILILKENDGTDTGREIKAEVVYILEDPKFCKEDFVILSIRILSIKLMSQK